MCTLSSGTEIRPVLRAVFLSAEFRDSGHHYQRYSWPVEFVVRALKEEGHVGFSANSRHDAAAQHGAAVVRAARCQRMGAWAGVVFNRRHAGAHEFRVGAGDQPAVRAAQLHAAVQPDAADAWSITPSAGSRCRKCRRPIYSALVDYVRAGGTWTGSEAQLLNKAGGVFHLLTGSGEYQFV